MSGSISWAGPATQDKIYELKKKANWIRREVLEMISSAGKGHIGGTFSCADILTALYYAPIMRFNPADKDWDGRDRFIMSKGHSAAALYAILADLGYFDHSELRNYQKEGCILGGHPDRKIPGIEADTGSLGHGFGIAGGLALAGKLDRKDALVFVLLGDGECCEGSVWEAAMFAARHRLGRLVAIIDRNGFSAMDATKDCVKLEPLEEKWKAFGWDVMTVDGHSFEELLKVFSAARSRIADRPLVIIANTVKGKGVSFMENNPDWHHRVPIGEELEIARRELSRVTLC